MPLRAAALAACSGLLLAASFPPLDLSVLSWFALVPLLSALRGVPAQQGFRLGGITGLACFLLTLHWLAQSLHLHGRMPLVPASLLTLLLCAYCSLYPALFGAAAVPLRRRFPHLFPFAAAAAWTALELVRTHVLTGFPWALLGYTQYRILPVIQIADIAGVYGISFVIVLVNSSLETFLRDRRNLIPLLTAVAFLGIIVGYGALQLQRKDGAARLRVAVVQANIDQQKKWDPAYQDEVLETYERLTRRAAKRSPDLILWPETATPFYFGGSGKSDAGLTTALRKFVRTTGIPLVTGSPTYVQRGNEYLLKNTAFLLARDGATDAVYHKMHLVPFGEYIPLKNSLFFFAGKLVRTIGDFKAGSEYTVMQVRSATGKTGLAAVICYEMIFPGLVRRFVNDGASVVTTITNDAWFGRSGAPYQHFSMAVLRAVENRVPVARAANTGISGFIDGKGRVMESSPLFTEAVLVRGLAPGRRRTFYTRYGDAFAWLCLAASIALIAFPPGDGPRRAGRSSGRHRPLMHRRPR